VAVLLLEAGADSRAACATPTSLVDHPAVLVERRRLTRAAILAWEAASDAEREARRRARWVELGKLCAWVRVKNLVNWRLAITTARARAYRRRRQQRQAAAAAAAAGQR